MLQTLKQQRCLITWFRTNHTRLIHSYKTLQVKVSLMSFLFRPEVTLRGFLREKGQGRCTSGDLLVSGLSPFMCIYLDSFVCCIVLLTLCIFYEPAMSTTKLPHVG